MKNYVLHNTYTLLNMTLAPCTCVEVFIRFTFSFVFLSFPHEFLEIPFILIQVYYCIDLQLHLPLIKTNISLDLTALKRMQIDFRKKKSFWIISYLIDTLGGNLKQFVLLMNNNNDRKNNLCKHASLVSTVMMLLEWYVICIDARWILTQESDLYFDLCLHCLFDMSCYKRFPCWGLAPCFCFQSKVFDNFFSPCICKMLPLYLNMFKFLYRTTWQRATSRKMRLKWNSLLFMLVKNKIQNLINLLQRK